MNFENQRIRIVQNDLSHVTQGTQGAAVLICMNG